MHKCRKCNGRIFFDASFFHWFHVGVINRELCKMNPPEPQCDHACVGGEYLALSGNKEPCPNHPQAHEAVYGKPKKPRKPRKKKTVVASTVEGFDYLEAERG